MKKILYAFVVIILLSSCSEEEKQLSDIHEKKSQEVIIKKYLKNGAWNYHYLSKEWSQWIDKGLKKDSTIAYLWQQKAMPFWKQKKYSIATIYYNKAVKLNRQKWLSRLAFLKCIFAKNYQSALVDLTNYKKEFGSTYEQDHTLEFYMGICYLQLDQFDNALKILKENILDQEEKYGTSWPHFLDRYYLAIAHYELNDYKNAISEFDKVLKEYPTFSDAQYYKSLALNYIGKKSAAKSLMINGKINFEKGNTFNEDSSLYEIYPYQLTWQWKATKSILK